MNFNNKKVLPKSLSAFKRMQSSRSFESEFQDLPKDSAVSEPELLTAPPEPSVSPATEGKATNESFTKVENDEDGLKFANKKGEKHDSSNSSQSGAGKPPKYSDNSKSSDPKK